MNRNQVDSAPKNPNIANHQKSNMTAITQRELKAYVNRHIPNFHHAKLESLKKLQLLKLLSKKNPYSLKINGQSTPRDFVESIVHAFLSSKEEILLNKFLMGLAFFTAEKAHRAHVKLSTTGVALELNKNGIRYFVAVKSGPSRGDSTLIDRMRLDFSEAARMSQYKSKASPVRYVYGCCYGKQSRNGKDKGDHLKLCGQRFWEFISNDPAFYVKIIEPIGHLASMRNVEFLSAYELVIDGLTALFRKHFCDSKNLIQWNKLVKHFSGSLD